MMWQTGPVGGCVPSSFGSRAKCLIPERPQPCTTATFFGLVKEDYTRKPLRVRLCTTWPDGHLRKKQTTTAVCSAPYQVIRSELAEETDDYCPSTKHTTRLHSNSYGLPRNHGFRAKARSITYADCVSIVLVIKHATRMRRIYCHL